jgi:sugar lactone lactonase YvrE
MFNPILQLASRAMRLFVGMLAPTMVLAVLLPAANAAVIAQLSPAVSAIAGNGTSGYSGDNGAATSAQLSDPQGIAFDAAGNLYWTDFSNCAVRKLTVATGIITTVVGTGPSGTCTYGGPDGSPAASASIGSGHGVVFDAAGNLYIDDWSDSLILKVDTSGNISKFAGGGNGGSCSGAGGPALSAQLSGPDRMVFDSSGNLLFPDEYCQVIWQVSPSGTISVFAGTAGTSGYSGDGGVATAATLANPFDLVFDSAGNLYFTDGGNNVVRKIAAGTHVLSTVAGNQAAGSGSAGDGGPATSAQLNNPQGIAIDAAGNLYVDGNGTIREVDAVTGIIFTVAGANPLPGSDGLGDGLPLVNVSGLATSGGFRFDAAGNFYIADNGANVIREAVLPSPAVRTTTVGATSTGPTFTFVFETATTVGSVAALTQGAANLDFVTGAGGTCTATSYAADAYCSVAINFSPTAPGLRKGSAALLDGAGNAIGQAPVFGIGQGPLIAFDAGTLSRVTVNYPLSGQDAAQDQTPQGAAVDNAGNVYVTSVRGGSAGGSTATDFIVQIKPDGTQTKIDGSASPGGTFWVPEVAVDSFGNLVVADTGNNRMLYITNPGQASSVTSVINTGNIFATDPSTNLPYNYHPFAPAVDQYNNVFFATNDSSTHSAGNVWEISATGVVSQVNLGSYTISAGSAFDLSVDSSGRLYVTDASNNRILVVTNPGQASSTTSVLAISGAALNFPTSTSVDAAGNVYIANNGNATIVVVSPSGAARVVSLKNPDGSDFYDTSNAASAAPFHVSVDQSGNLYFTNETTTGGGTPYGGTLEKLAMGTPMPLAFVNPANAAITPATYFDTMSSDSPQSVIAFNIGNSELDFSAPSPAITPASFSLDAATTCPASGAAAYNIQAGASCTLAVDFIPQAIGPISGTLTLSDNSLDIGPNQTIALSGTGIALPTTTTVVSSLNPSVYGQNVTFTATVVPSVSTASTTIPVGTVQFSIDGTPVGSPVTLDASGNATYAIATLAVGAHAVTAAYTPSSTTFLASDDAAAPLSQQVTPAALTVTADNLSRQYGAADPAFTYTITGFVNGDTASVVGGSATLASTDTPTSPAGSTFPITFASQGLTATNYTFVYVAGTLTITGNASQTISFTVASPVTYGVAPIALNGVASSGLPVSYTVTGPATVSGSTLTITGAGTVVVTAHQAGDANYAAASDVPQTILVNPAPTATTLTSAPNPSTPGQIVTFTATVSSTAGTPTGSVTFLDSGTVLGTGAVNASGVATFTTSTLTVGTHPVTAAYAGATNFAASTSTVDSQVVTTSSVAMTLTSSRNPSTLGQSVTFTATVSASTSATSVGTAKSAAAVGPHARVSANATPTGTVTFRDAGTSIGTGALDANGIATLTTPALAVGSHPITATYPGDGSNSAASASLTQIVNSQVVPQTAAPAPALSTWAMLLLVLGFVGVGFAALRARQPRE